MSKASNGSHLLLHIVNGSPPSSAVIMLGDILGLHIDCKLSDVWKSEQDTRDFKKLIAGVPCKMILTLFNTSCPSRRRVARVDICKITAATRVCAHAMLIYLTTKYGGEQREKLYPSDFNTRAIIDHLMFWETGVLFIRLKVPAILIKRDGGKAPTKKQIADIDEAYLVLEVNLSNRLYIATDHLTIADLSLGSTATAIQAIHKLDSNRFPLTVQWLARLNEEECFKKINAEAVFHFSERVKTALERNNK